MLQIEELYQWKSLKYLTMINKICNCLKENVNLFCFFLILSRGNDGKWLESLHV